MVTPKLKSISARGFKSLGDVTLPLEGLSVLIGDNGSGKSSILEVLEILRCTTHEGFLGRISSAHGGSLLTEHGAPGFTLAATIDDGADEPLQYQLTWYDTTAPIETIHRGDIRGIRDFSFIKASREAKIGGEPIPIDLRESLVYFGARQNPVVSAIAEAFRGIEVHLPFQVTAHWAAASPDRRWSRGITLIEPTTRLERFGTNLVNAYQALKNDFGIDHWNETLEYIHLGLGHQVRDVRLEAIPGGGHMALALEIEGQGRVPALSLADGVLSYLAFVALFRLDEGRTLLAFDEPEVHLHPGLLMRVLGLFETMSDRYPVILATHSDRLLDGLSDPARSVVVTELDDRSRTRIRRLDAEQLADWMTDYRGLGDLRSDGELRSVLAAVVQQGDDGRGAPASTP